MLEKAAVAVPVLGSPVTYRHATYGFGTSTLCLWAILMWVLCGRTKYYIPRGTVEEAERRHRQERVREARRGVANVHSSPRRNSSIAEGLPMVVWRPAAE